MTDTIAVLFANEAFYQAFAERDLEAMDTVWSRGETVSCVHPGWHPLAGRDAVMESWRTILSDPAAPDIACRNASAYLLGDVAYVLCHEALESGFLIATNVFVREGGPWKMVHHQAGMGPAPAAEAAETVPGRLQ